MAGDCFLGLSTQRQLFPHQEGKSPQSDPVDPRVRSHTSRCSCLRGSRDGAGSKDLLSIHTGMEGAGLFQGDTQSQLAVRKAGLQRDWVFHSTLCSGGRPALVSQPYGSDGLSRLLLALRTPTCNTRPLKSKRCWAVVAHVWSPST